MTKIRVITKVSKKTIAIIFSVWLIFIAGISFSLYKDFEHCKDFVSVDAVVTDIVIYEYDGDDGSESQKYLNLSYVYNGTEYKSQKRVSMLTFKKKNSSVAVKINPEYPTEIEQTYTRNAKIGIDIFFIIFEILMGFALVFGKPQKYSGQEFNGEVLRIEKMRLIEKTKL